MSEMVERVAKVAADFDKRTWNGMGRVDRQRYLDRARLEIQAMREPSTAMTHAASAALKAHIDALPVETRAKSKEKGGVVFVGPLEKHEIRWRAMIDAAIAPPQSTQGGAVSQGSGHSTSKL